MESVSQQIGEQSHSIEDSLKHGDETFHHYRKHETKSSSAAPHAAVHILHAKEFGSGLSIASHRLASSKATLQSSWVNVAVPVPLGASHLALDSKDELDAYKSQEDLDNEKRAPPDRFRIVYLIFMLQGIGFLLPWNMFVTANSYFTEFKLAAKGNETETEYAKNFLSYLGISALLPNVTMCLINVCVRTQKSSPTPRIAGSIGVLITMFLMTIVLAMVDSQNWQGTFFGLTMATVVIINMFSGVYQTSIYGIAGVFPMKYTNAVILGTNTSGILTSMLMILNLLSSQDLQLAAIWYFISAVIVLCFALIAYFLLPGLRFYKHFAKPKNSDSDEDSQTTLVNREETESVDERPPYLLIFKKIWLQLLGVWMTFFVSLICFPAIQADIAKADPNMFIPDMLYTPITTFLFFNLFATLGNLATEWIRKPGPKFVIIPIALRLLYIPFFMFCNFRPEVRSFPVYINNDYAYFAGGITMAFTSGYFSSLCMMYAPSLVERRWAGTAAMLAGFFLTLGLVCGVNFTLVIAKLIEVL